MRHECAHCSDSDRPHPCGYVDGFRVQRPLRRSLDLSKEIFKLDLVQTVQYACPPFISHSSPFGYE